MVMHNFEEKTKYLEKPVTTDERAVALLIETMAKAVSRRDILALESVIAEDAQITFFQSGQKALNKSECILYLKRVGWHTRNISYSEILIRTKKDEATVSCTGRILFKDGYSKRVVRIFRCKKRDDAWLISEAGYI